MAQTLYIWQRHPTRPELFLAPLQCPGVAALPPGATPADAYIEVVLELPAASAGDPQSAGTPTNSNSAAAAAATTVPVIRDVKCRALPQADKDGDLLRDIAGDTFAADAVHCFTVARLALQMFMDDRRLVFRSSRPWEWAFTAASKRPLRIVAHAGEREDSCYHRSTGSLKFFHVTTDEGRSFLCRGFDVVAHETGHAILDALNPTLYAAKDGEVAAFHEAFADLVAVFALIATKELAQPLLQRSGGDLRRPSELTAVGLAFVEFRTAVAQIYAPGSDQDNCMSLKPLDERGASGCSRSSSDECMAAVRDVNNDVNGFSCSRGVYTMCSLFSGFVWDVVVAVCSALRRSSSLVQLDDLQAVAKFLRVLLTVVVTRDVRGKDFSLLKVAEAMASRSAEVLRLLLANDGGSVVSLQALDPGALKGIIEKSATDRQLAAVSMSRARYRASLLGDY